MKLFLISQTENQDYDTFDSVVVAAETEEIASTIHPYFNKDWWDGEWEDSWCSSPDKVSVKYLGEAAEGTSRGVILASFNAG